jgi:hypothetical protein
MTKILNAARDVSGYSSAVMAERCLADALRQRGLNPAIGWVWTAAREALRTERDLLLSSKAPTGPSSRMSRNWVH